MIPDHFEKCPLCATPSEAVDGIYWCQPCQLAWFRWTDVDEAKRLEEVGA